MYLLSVKYSENPAIVDDDISAFLSCYNWSFFKNYVCRSDSKHKIVKLHKIVWQYYHGKIPEGYEVDHKDRNTLNNQIKNLRLATKKQNVQNRGKQKNNTSGYIGVGKCQMSGVIYWRARIVDNNGKRKSRCFPFTVEGLEEAAKWYDKKALELRGEFAVLNFN